MAMDDQLVASFGDFNDAAYAMGHCQLSQVTRAAGRLEMARSDFYNLFMRGVKEDAISARDHVQAPAVWPAHPGWYWAFGRIAGMAKPTLMSAFAAIEADKMIVYVGEAMTHRLSFPDPEMPLQFKPAVLPEF